MNPCGCSRWRVATTFIVALSTVTSLVAGARPRGGSPLGSSTAQRYKAATAFTEHMDLLMADKSAGLLNDAEAVRAVEQFLTSVYDEVASAPEEEAGKAAPREEAEGHSTEDAQGADALPDSWEELAVDDFDGILVQFIEAVGVIPKPVLVQAGLEKYRAYLCHQQLLARCASGRSLPGGSRVDPSPDFVVTSANPDEGLAARRSPIRISISVPTPPSQSPRRSRLPPHRERAGSDLPAATGTPRENAPAREFAESRFTAAETRESHSDPRVGQQNPESSSENDGGGTSEQATNTATTPPMAQATGPPQPRQVYYPPPFPDANAAPYLPFFAPPLQHVPLYGGMPWPGGPPVAPRGSQGSPWTAKQEGRETSRDSAPEDTPENNARENGSPEAPGSASSGRPGAEADAGSAVPYSPPHHGHRPWDWGPAPPPYFAPPPPPPPPYYDPYYDYFPPYLPPPGAPRGAYGEARNATQPDSPLKNSGRQQLPLRPRPYLPPGGGPPPRPGPGGGPQRMRPPSPPRAEAGRGRGPQREIPSYRAAGASRASPTASPPVSAEPSPASEVKQETNMPLSPSAADDASGGPALGVPGLLPPATSPDEDVKRTPSPANRRGWGQDAGRLGGEGQPVTLEPPPPHSDRRGATDEHAIPPSPSPLSRGETPAAGSTERRSPPFGVLPTVDVLGTTAGGSDTQPGWLPRRPPPGGRPPPTITTTSTVTTTQEPDDMYSTRPVRFTRPPDYLPPERRPPRAASRGGAAGVDVRQAGSGATETRLREPPLYPGIAPSTSSSAPPRNRPTGTYDDGLSELAQEPGSNVAALPPQPSGDSFATATNTRPPPRYTRPPDYLPPDKPPPGPEDPAPPPSQPGPMPRPPDGGQPYPVPPYYPPGFPSPVYPPDMPYPPPGYPPFHPGPPPGYPSPPAPGYPLPPGAPPPPETPNPSPVPPGTPTPPGTPQPAPTTTTTRRPVRYTRPPQYEPPDQQPPSLPDPAPTPVPPTPPYPPPVSPPPQPVPPYYPPYPPYYPPTPPPQPPPGYPPEQSYPPYYPPPQPWPGATQPLRPTSPEATQPDDGREPPPATTGPPVRYTRPPKYLIRQEDSPLGRGQPPQLDDAPALSPPPFDSLYSSQPPAGGDGEGPRLSPPSYFSYPDPNHGSAASPSERGGPSLPAPPEVQLRLPVVPVDSLEPLDPGKFPSDIPATGGQARARGERESPDASQGAQDPLNPPTRYSPPPGQPASQPPPNFAAPPQGAYSNAGGALFSPEATIRQYPPPPPRAARPPGRSWDAVADLAGSTTQQGLSLVPPTASDPRQPQLARPSQAGAPSLVFSPAPPDGRKPYAEERPAALRERRAAPLEMGALEMGDYLGPPMQDVPGEQMRLQDGNAFGQQPVGALEEQEARKRRVPPGNPPRLPPPQSPSPPLPPYGGTTGGQTPADYSGSPSRPDPFLAPARRPPFLLPVREEDSEPTAISRSIPPPNGAFAPERDIADPPSVGAGQLKPGTSWGSAAGGDLGTLSRLCPDCSSEELSESDSWSYSDSEMSSEESYAFDRLSPSIRPPLAPPQRPPSLQKRDTPLASPSLSYPVPPAYAPRRRPPLAPLPPEPTYPLRPSTPLSYADDFERPPLAARPDLLPPPPTPQPVPVPPSSLPSPERQRLSLSPALLETPTGAPRPASRLQPPLQLARPADPLRPPTLPLPEARALPLGAAPPSSDYRVPDPRIRNEDEALVPPALLPRSPQLAPPLPEDSAGFVVPPPPLPPRDVQRPRPLPAGAPELNDETYSRMEVPLTQGRVQPPETLVRRAGPPGPVRGARGDTGPSNYVYESMPTTTEFGAEVERDWGVGERERATRNAGGAAELARPPLSPSWRSPPPLRASSPPLAAPPRAPAAVPLRTRTYVAQAPPSFPSGTWTAKETAVESVSREGVRQPPPLSSALPPARRPALSALVPSPPAPVPGPLAKPAAEAVLALRGDETKAGSSLASSPPLFVPSASSRPLGAASKSVSSRREERPKFAAAAQRWSIRPSWREVAAEGSPGLALAAREISPLSPSKAAGGAVFVDAKPEKGFERRVGETRLFALPPPSRQTLRPRDGVFEEATGMSFFAEREGVDKTELSSPVRRPANAVLRPTADSAGAVGAPEQKAEPGTAVLIGRRDVLREQMKSASSLVPSAALPTFSVRDAAYVRTTSSSPATPQRVQITYTDKSPEAFAGKEGMRTVILGGEAPPKRKKYQRWA
ncbi:hypothetical protein BESB_084560 [Besnoitia besnoiti]|uniref:Uncharacterized protein n=1 Tax=Besnoitia besnoiti TaxID=94643 RepID=A0A2A9MCB9_BESBE|nr:hypothetical protein BESB_084560 [Besnoitia besnoiti]PFH33257.1 hypothetical protein BESB_084560 [Besnoitia besnoiti]